MHRDETESVGRKLRASTWSSIMIGWDESENKLVASYSRNDAHMMDYEEPTVLWAHHRHCHRRHKAV